MKQTAAHPSQEMLLAVLVGDAESDKDPSEEAREEVFAHLESCEHCFQRLDALWAITSPFRDVAAVQMDSLTAEMTERRILRRLHQTELAERVTELGSQGFLTVILGLLRPILSLGVATQSTLSWRRL